MLIRYFFQSYAKNLGFAKLFVVLKIFLFFKWEKTVRRANRVQRISDEVERYQCAAKERVLVAKGVLQFIWEIIISSVKILYNLLTIDWKFWLRHSQSKKAEWRRILNRFGFSEPDEYSTNLGVKQI